MANAYYRMNPAPVCSSCAECILLPECGGLDGDDYNKGCFQRCDSHCRDRECDSVCPCAPVGFDDRWAEVHGICIPPAQCNPVLQAGSLPFYVPQVHHGSMRSRTLFEPIIAVPLAAIVRKQRGHLDVCASSHSDLCDKLSLSRRAKLILTCVSQDALIEEFWMDHRYKGLLEKIRELDFLGVTVPNYSFMLDVPRSNSLYNLSRMFRMIERMSETGIPTIPHINASTKADWKKWTGFLQSFPNVVCFAAEFQTGLSQRERRGVYLRNLAEMIHALGRVMHPVVVGGTGGMADLRGMFEQFTLIDSTPFMKSMHRQKLQAASGNARPRWRPQKTSPGECLGALLAENISTHRKFICTRAGFHEGNYLQQHLKVAA
jgi:hypothetical protein